MRYAYSALYYCLLPLILGRMLLRSRRAPAYRQRWRERFGIFPVTSAEPAQRVLWVHAVSVGETIAAVPLLEALLQQYPEHRIVVTTTTPTGSEQLRKRFGERVFHVYLPWDLPGAVQRFLSRLQPELLLLMETELWPNLLHYTAASGCRIVLANARMSARSARGYRRVARLSRSMLQNLDRVACQSAEDGQRLLSLGLDPARLEVTGSIKFDLELDGGLREEAAELRSAWSLDRRPVWVAGSTHAGEDEHILDAFVALRRAHSRALLVLAPRHPERFSAVYELCIRAGWNVLRRSGTQVPGPDDAIVLADTMGELLLLYGIADVAFVGGSLVPHGGHNVLEAAAWGVPVITGPSMFNFTQISELMVAAGAMLQLPDARELGSCVSALLADGARCERMGAAAQALVTANRGARQRLLELLAGFVTQATPDC